MTDGSDLPPELIARMMDFLRGEKQTLRRCSLVCRAWVFPSQRQLFRRFNLAAHRVYAFANLLGGAPHLGTYIREISFLGPRVGMRDKAMGRRDARMYAAQGAAHRVNIQRLLSFLPNITAIHASALASSPFVFTNNALRQCPKLRQFSILGTLSPRAVVSPTSIFPSFEGTTVKYVKLRDLNMPSMMHSPLNSHPPVCAIGRLSLSIVASEFLVWLPYIQSVLPMWKSLKVTVNSSDIHALLAWSRSLRTSNLSSLDEFHFEVRIYTSGQDAVAQFPPGNLLSSALPNHLLLTAKLCDEHGDILRLHIIYDMIEWYLCTLRALAQEEQSTLKKLTLTVMALQEPIIAAAWAEVDDTLSSPAFTSLEKVRFLDVAGSTCSIPQLAGRLQEVLPKLSRSGKLAV